jgi:hypothetical protein
MRKLTGPTLAAVAAALLAAPAAAPAATRACADSDRFLQQLKATNVTCKTAREIMFAWARSSKCIRGGDGLLADRARTCTIRHFQLVPRKAEGGVRVRGTRGDEVIRFFDSAG